MEWRSPWMFLLLLLPVLVLLIRFLKKNQYIASLQFSHLKILSELRSGWKARFVNLPLYLKLFALVLWIVAMARPQEPSTKVRRDVEGIDIVIALDISDSMLIEDMKPLNRMEAAKEVIQQFVEKRASDRIGLVIFAGESFTLVPPTLDYPLLLSRLKEVTTAQEARIKDGTAIGVALANASGRLKDSNAKSRVIIFLTDGENNSGTIDPETALEIAKGYGLKIHSIGIGRDGPTKIPVYQRDLFGNKIKTYQPFESSVNEDLLNRMAKDTGGKYFRATRDDALKGVFQEIDRLEKTKVEVSKYTRYTELFPSYLKWGVIILFFAWLLEWTVFRRGL